MTTPTNCGRRAVLQRLGASLLLPMAWSSHAAVAVKPDLTLGSLVKPLRLAVVPQLSPVEMTRNWMPVLESLASIGIHAELAVYPSIAKFETEFMSGRADLVYLNPYHMVMARRKHGYVPLVRDTRPLEGVLLVQQDGPVHRVAQLKEHRISFPAPNAFAASLYLRSVLERQFQIPIEAHYAQNHRDAVRQVLVGDSAAAGMVKTTLEKETLDVQRQLRVIYTTPPLSPHPVAAHPRIPPDLRQKIGDHLIGLGANPLTAATMQAMLMPHPVAAHYARDYAALEQLKIEKYVVTE
jgi:phosphonate transport system substrate-binding protein